jgi:hypothetical protein
MSLTSSPAWKRLEARRAQGFDMLLPEDLSA